MVFLSGCSTPTKSGPKSVSETSRSRPELAARIAFIEQYVTFSRTYLKLEYDIQYNNHSEGMVPGPSDWDIKILAVVPPDEIEDWIPKGVSKSKGAPPAWVASMKAEISTDGVTEWYEKERIKVGIDRTDSIVVYRNATN